MEGVKNELAAVNKKRSAYASSVKSIDDMIAILQATTQSLEQNDSLSLKGVTSAVSAVAKSTAEAKSSVSKEFKNLASAVTAFGAEIEKTVPTNLEKAINADVRFSPAAVNEVIADALLRDGRFAIVQSLANESAAVSAATTVLNPSLSAAAAASSESSGGSGALARSLASSNSAALESLRIAFEELHNITASLRARNVQPAIAWAVQERANLTRLIAAPPPPPPALLAQPTPLPTTSTNAPPPRSSPSNDMSDVEPSGRAAPAAPAGVDSDAAQRASNALANRMSAVTDLLFGLHRLRFLQLLTVDSPCTVHHVPAPAPIADTKRSHSAAGASAPTKMEKDDTPPPPSASPPIHSLYASALGSPVPSSSAGNGYSPPSQAIIQARIASYTIKALQYAQQNFAPFASTHLREIQRLSGCVLFGWDLARASAVHRNGNGANGGSSGVASGPDLSSAALWVDIEQSFSHACYASLGLAARSPLLTTLRVSDIALPKQIKYATIMAQHASARAILAEGGKHSALGAEVDLGREHQYHSTFICPVTNDQSTSDNPPVLLKCGHVISRNAMEKMIRSSRSHRSAPGRFKCPTCPKEMTAADTITLHF